MGRYRAVIGLEIHVQLMTETKMFCSCSTDSYDSPPNTHICPVCTGQPGALPVINEKAVDYAVKAALAMNFQIHRYSRFDRKNYFYPDLPKGYQITQYFYPLATGGYLEIETESGVKRIRIRRLHIEEDAGKLIHESDSIRESEHTFVDLNRAGVPLIEIVTEPDLSSPREARLFMEKLRSVVRYLEISSGDMEKGALRCDANISVLDEETGRSSNRVEVKNMNSFKFVEKALEYEFNRISSAMTRGENIPQETRGWDSRRKVTIPMRTKEEESDYRYFPEPDLPPLVITEDRLERLKGEIPELPDQKKARFIRDYSLPEYDAGVLTSDKRLADYFERVVSLTGKPKEVSNWMMTEMLRMINEEGVDLDDVKIKPEHFKEIFDLIDSGRISKNIAKEVFREVFKTGRSPGDIVSEKGLERITDERLIEEIIRKAMEENPKAVEQYRSGKKGVLGYFMGKVMKETKGKADPKLASSIARKLLESG